MEVINYIYDQRDYILKLAAHHALLVFIAVGLATICGVSIGLLISRHERAARLILYVASIIVTIPSIALFGLMIPLLSIVNQGIGNVPAIVAVFLYSQLPIIRNTYTAVVEVDPNLREAANGIGLDLWQRLYLLELPLAAPVILAGIRTAVVMNIGVMAIAAYIGAGGLGELISRGISQSDHRQLVAGAIAVSVLAIFVDILLSGLQRRLTLKVQK
ncbi:ABC transporter permease [Alcaligenes nematophilus]|uniref:ABC transporter permease n=1 Tax=Alcaligenes nematophilus TaxID=2994643 RepID=UPI00246724DB|nr:ABC transporter permease [Alcaligenes nematophilus]MDH4865420.1 ABC transporter permease [Bacillus cereus]MDY7126719.1 ABC transporter permease [Alcaligenes nematophilus]